jgi:hypothetical protein
LFSAPRPVRAEALQAASGDQAEASADAQIASRSGNGVSSSSDQAHPAAGVAGRGGLSQVAGAAVNRA